MNLQQTSASNGERLNADNSKAARMHFVYWLKDRAFSCAWYVSEGPSVPSNPFLQHNNPKRLDTDFAVARHTAHRSLIPDSRVASKCDGASGSIAPVCAKGVPFRMVGSNSESRGRGVSGADRDRRSPLCIYVTGLRSGHTNKRTQPTRQVPLSTKDLEA